MAALKLRVHIYHSRCHNLVSYVGMSRYPYLRHCLLPGNKHNILFSFNFNNFLPCSHILVRKNKSQTFNLTQFAGTNDNKLCWRPPVHLVGITSQKARKELSYVWIRLYLIAIYSVMIMKQAEKNKLLAMEKDYLRSVKLCKRDRTRNDGMKWTGGKETIIDTAETKELKLYGHAMRMEDDRWSKRLYNWIQPGNRKR